MEWEQDISMFDWFFTPNNTSSKVIAITIGTIKYCYNIHSAHQQSNTSKSILLFQKERKIDCWGLLLCGCWMSLRLSFILFENEANAGRMAHQTPSFNNNQHFFSRSGRKKCLILLMSLPRFRLVRRCAHQFHWRHSFPQPIFNCLMKENCLHSIDFTSLTNFFLSASLMASLCFACLGGGAHNQLSSSQRLARSTKPKQRKFHQIAQLFLSNPSNEARRHSFDWIVEREVELCCCANGRQLFLYFFFQLIRKSWKEKK